MIDLKILDISKTSINYSCEDPDDVAEKGFAKIDYELKVDDVENDESKKIAKVYFSLILTPVDFSPGEIIEDNDIDAKIEFTYKMLIQTSNELEEIDELLIMPIVEPYIRKEIFDFFTSVGLPNIPMPYRFWDNAKKK